MHERDATQKAGSSALFGPVSGIDHPSPSAHPPKSSWCCGAAAIALAIAAIMALADRAPALESVPMPRPRPSGAAPRPPAAQTGIVPGEAAKPEAGELPAVPPPSACRQRLTPDIAVIEPLPPFTAPGGCGAEDVVRLDAVFTKDKGRVAITPPATLRCPMAEAVIHWVRDEAAPAAAELGATLKAVANYASYECRSRNRIAGAILSQHGLANAIDVRALVLANGKAVELTDIAVAKPIRERLKQSACTRFTTVLGPGSDGYHENHIHLDLAERRSGYRLCQWAVHDPSDLAPPLPRERPPEAPPRDGGTVAAPKP